jgi:hypothetical protein
MAVFGIRTIQGLLEAHLGKTRGGRNARERALPSADRRQHQPGPRIGGEVGCYRPLSDHDEWGGRIGHLSSQERGRVRRATQGRARDPGKDQGGESPDDQHRHGREALRGASARPPGQER